MNDQNKQPQTFNEQNEAPALIEMPESIRESLTVPARDMGAVALDRTSGGRYGNGVVPLEGRYGTAPIVVERPAGIPIEVAGFDTVTSQARQVGDISSSPVPTGSIDTEEV